MNKEILKLTKNQAQDIVYGLNKDYKTISKEIIDTTRWSNVFEIVVQRISDGKYFKDCYNVGATETQDEGPYDYTDPEFIEVEKKEKTIFVYE